MTTPAAIAAMFGLAVVVLVLGAVRSNQPALARRRLDRLGEVPLPGATDGSFAERLLAPMVAGLVRAVASALPTRLVGSTRRYLDMAGNPVSLERFLTAWSATALVLPLVAVLVVVAGGGAASRTTLFTLGLVTLLGFLIPWRWLRGRARQRSRAIQRGLPDAIDLIITNVEAGLGLQAALLVVAEKTRGPISEEFARVVREISLGRPRSEAFTLMATRCGVMEMRLFARAVAQSEQTGTPIARVLRNHAAESRERRRQRAREQAAKVPVKITLPTVIFMFPTLLMLVLGPVGIYAFDLLTKPK